MVAAIANAAKSSHRPAPGADDYVVRRGDTLSGIAQRHGVSLAALARANPEIRNLDLIRPGQRLDIPAAATSRTHEVARGDSLWSIAHRFDVPLRDLLAANPTLARQAFIYPGDQVSIPGGRESADVARKTGPSARARAAPTHTPADAPATGQVAPTTPTQQAALGGLSEAGLRAIHAREAVPGVSNRLHWPEGASGVTLGAGYDLKNRSRDEIVRDLTAIGIDRTTAQAVSAGAGLVGAQAQAFAGANRNLVNLSSTQETNLLRDTVPAYAQAVRDAVRVPLNQNQFDALVSFAYNVGTPSFRDSTLLRRLNEGDYAAVGPQMARWNKSEGRVGSSKVLSTGAKARSRNSTRPRGRPRLAPPPGRRPRLGPPPPAPRPTSPPASRAAVTPAPAPILPRAGVSCWRFARPPARGPMAAAAPTTTS